MFWVAMACEHNHFVATVLEPYCSIDDQSFRPSNAQVGVEEEDGLWLVSCRHVAALSWGRGRRRGHTEVQYLNRSREKMATGTGSLI